MNEIEEIFAYWQEMMEKPRAKLLPIRKKLIKARLKEGYTMEEIEKAINGCWSSPFHRGVNPNGTIYDDIELICRNGVKLEKFISMWEQGSERARGTGISGQS